MLIKRWFASLVNRAVLFMVAGIILSTLVVVFLGSWVSRAELEAQARQQVSTIAELVAGDLDARLAQRRDTLAHVAENLTVAEEVLKGRGEVFVRRDISLQHLFDVVFLFDADGNAIASHPEKFSAAGLSVADRAYFTETSSQLTPVISEPFVSRYQDRPAIMMTAPVFDHRKRFIGVIAGALFLKGENFMTEPGSIDVGKTGYVTVATRNGMVLTHGRTGESMLPVQVDSAAVRSAMDGFEGATSAHSSDGVETIMAVRQLSQVPWYVAAVWPADEAYGPVHRLTDSLVLVLLGVLLVGLPTALIVFRRLMAPLKMLGAQISDRHLGVRTQPVDEVGGTEIRQVAETFNTVMEERDEVMASLAEREAFFRSLTRSAPIGIVQTDVLGRIEFANPAFEQIVGVPSNDLQQSILIEGVYEDDRPSALEAWYQALHNRTIFRARFRLKSLDKGLVWADVMTAVIDTEEKTLGTITVVRDITHELEIESRLAEEQARANSILGVLQEGVLMTDAQGAIRYANAAVGEFLGLEDIGEGEPFFEQVTISDNERTWKAEELLHGDDRENLYVTLKNVHGDSFDIDLTVLHLRPDTDRPRVVFVIRDDSERRREEERLSWEATHDSLTGLLNRRAFNASLIHCLTEMSPRTNDSVLMLIDLDYFKPVNDEGGHLLGDDLLMQLSELLVNTVRQSDTVARLGGDEFGIILPTCGLERAQTLAEQIRAGIEALRLQKDGRDFGVTASIGLTMLNGSDSGVREVLARADEGTYAAKAQGRNQVIVMPPSARH
ncbi:diguanylate cyclase domain-containing protein [Marinobacter confluentis]|uniref:Diguanylate cyclase n=1 Tax=Marinobacter confluentis TaxID=1697557 RepID=A0A4Z1C2L9_9GAMM|nr:diguanylate cyclase [Marinobacter confluentis]TGN39342.1 diguanylate cyclase [Marinobacter confluentis]